MSVIRTLLCIVLVTMFVSSGKAQIDGLKVSIDQNDSIKTIHKLNKNKYYYYKNEAINYAIDKDNLAMIEYFIKSGKSVYSKKDIDDGFLYATEHNKIASCKIFLENKVDPNYSKQDYYFDTLMIWRDNKYVQMDFKVDENGEYWAALKSDPPKSIYLENALIIENKPMIYNAKLGDGMTAMYYAIKNNNLQLVDLLIKYGYDNSKTHIIETMATRFNIFMSDKIIFEFCAGGGEFVGNNTKIVYNHYVHTSIVPKPAVIIKPLQYALKNKANKDIVDLIKSQIK